VAVVVLAGVLERLQTEPPVFMAAVQVVMLAVAAQLGAVQSVLSGRVAHVHSHQLVQVIYEPLY
jgi:hypothetical protein